MQWLHGDCTQLTVLQKLLQGFYTLALFIKIDVRQPSKVVITQSWPIFVIFFHGFLQGFDSMIEMLRSLNVLGLSVQPLGCVQRLWHEQAPMATRIVKTFLMQYYFIRVQLSCWINTKQEYYYINIGSNREGLEDIGYC